MENKWEKIEESILDEMITTLERGEGEKGQTLYWVDTLYSFLKTKKLAIDLLLK